jgi:hypothetical protein
MNGRLGIFIAATAAIVKVVKSSRFRRRVAIPFLDAGGKRAHVDVLVVSTRGGHGSGGIGRGRRRAVREAGAAMVIGRRGRGGRSRIAGVGAVEEIVEGDFDGGSRDAEFSSTGTVLRVRAPRTAASGAIDTFAVGDGRRERVGVVKGHRGVESVGKIGREMNRLGGQGRVEIHIAGRGLFLRSVRRMKMFFV